MNTKLFSFAAVCVATGVLAASCGSDASETTAASGSDAEGAVVLMTHDSFAVSDGIFEQFTADTGIEVEIVSGGDAGELVSRAVLTAGAPEADVLFGIDNTFLQRGLDADIFTAYTSPGLSSVDESLQLDSEHRVTPIDVGDVCLNYWIDGLDAAPMTLEDLASPEFASTFVTPSPETSSPGFAFLLATIARFGEDGWEAYWESLVEGGVEISTGWEDAYYGSFAAGGGDRQIVTSYATSPVAEVVFADPPVDTPPTGVLTDSCFRQIEFVGVLAGTERPAGAQAVIDFMLSDAFQADIPLNMFVAPASSSAPLPDVFVEHQTVIDEPLTLDPATIEANRLDWTERWNEIVLQR